MTHRIRRGTVLVAICMAIPAFWTNAKAEPSWSRKHNAKRAPCHAVHTYQRIADQETSNFYRVEFQLTF